jgi:hypothetical protein
MESQAKEQLSDDTSTMELTMTMLLMRKKVEQTTLLPRMLSILQSCSLRPPSCLQILLGLRLWASSRQPSHVFILPENVNGAFDRRTGESRDCGGYKHRSFLSFF